MTINNVINIVTIEVFFYSQCQCTVNGAVQAEILRLIQFSQN